MRLSAIYANMTAIFPLLGILGTVIALLRVTGDLAGMETNFLAALTSTFWGLIASILFKFLDSFLSYRTESNEIYLSNFEETGKRYTVSESYAADGVLTITVREDAIEYEGAAATLDELRDALLRDYVADETTIEVVDDHAIKADYDEVVALLESMALPYVEKN